MAALLLRLAVMDALEDTGALQVVTAQPGASHNQ